MATTNGTDSAEFQKFLDTKQYNRNGILRYERIFGWTFVSTGGKQTTEVRASLTNTGLQHFSVHNF